MNRATLPFVFALCLTSSVFALEIKDATPEKFFGGAENLGIVMKAREVMVFRIVENETHGKKLVPVDGNQCEAGPKTVAGPEVENVVKQFSNMSNFGVMLMCDFDPAVIFRFETDAGTVDVVVCFGCGEMMLYRNGKMIDREFEFANHKNTFRRDARRAFTALAKKAFPDDPEIKSLP